MLKKIVCLVALCLSVKAQADTSTETPSATQPTNAEKIKVSPKNVSDLYIGDLLRTKPKEVLEVAGSSHQPIIASENYLSPVFASPSPKTGRSYKAHGGHEYVETEYSHPDTQSRSNTHSLTQRYGTSPRSVPVLGHILTLKPVRVVARDALPLSKSSGYQQRTTDHHPNDDCSKSTEHPYSSEEKPYTPEEQTYRRAKQVESDSPVEYRSPPSNYDEDDSSDRYSSHSDPSTDSSRSRTYPSDTNTKSHSSGSYTTSKSTSSSRSVTPSRPRQKARVVPTAVSAETDYDKDSTPAYVNQGMVVYKVKEAPSRGPSSYSENSGREYSPPNDDREYSSGHNDSPYSQYPTDSRKPRKHSHRERVNYSSGGQGSVKDKSQQHGPSTYIPSPIDQERGNYDQSSYAPPGEQRYPEHNKPSSGYRHESDYTPRPDGRGQGQPKVPYKSYDNSERVHEYKTEAPKPLSKKKQKSPHYETDHEIERPRYRSKEPSTQGYDYNTEQPIQSSRLRSLRTVGNYESYNQQEPRTESAPSSQSYERNHPDLRPSEEKEMNQYIYEATPHQADGKHSSRSHKRHYRESPRSIRSSAKYTKAIVVDGRAQMPVGRNVPLIMVSRESKPYVSHSVSYSNSGFTEDESTKAEPKSPNRNNKERPQQQDNPTTEGRQSAGFEQTVYKPYNSEYPASYANDPHTLRQPQYEPQSYEQHQPQSYEQHQPQSYEQHQPQSYEQHQPQSYDQHQPQSYGQQRPYDEPQSYDKNPSKYPSSAEHQPYENSRPQDDSNEEDYDAPAKPNKNHHYISNIEGYKDEYISSTPLHLDDAFFEKYGISKKAKIIVATAMKPNLFVADGTQISEGGHTGQEGGHREHIEEQRYEPNFKDDSKEDSYRDSPEELGAPKEIPGSFDDLVNTNPKFLRQLPQIMSPVDSFFKMDDSTDASFDEDEFRNVEQKGFVVSKGPREIVQQHGDGVSRILFNVPKVEGRSASSTDEDYKGDNRRADEEKILQAASMVLENIIKSDA